MRNGPKLRTLAIHGPYRLRRLDDLVSAWELTERLGYKNTIAFHTMRSRNAGKDFPEPILATGKGGKFLLWYWPDVLTWAYKNGRVDVNLLRQSEKSLGSLQYSGQETMESQTTRCACKER